MLILHLHLKALPSRGQLFCPRNFFKATQQRIIGAGMPAVKATKQPFCLPFHFTGRWITAGIIITKAVTDGIKPHFFFGNTSQRLYPCNRISALCAGIGGLRHDCIHIASQIVYEDLQGLVVQIFAGGENAGPLLLGSAKKHLLLPGSAGLSPQPSPGKDEPCKAGGSGKSGRLFTV